MNKAEQENVRYDEQYDTLTSTETHVYTFFLYIPLCLFDVLLVFVI